jgi:hypothetical protein
MDKFEATESNLLAQVLAELAGGELYVETALINSEEKEIIGLLRGVQKLAWFSEDFKKFCEEVIPFFVCYGIGKLELTELTGLGLKVGHKNQDKTEAEPE